MSASIPTFRKSKWRSVETAENLEHRLAVWKWRVLLATMVCYLFYYCGRFNLAVCMKPIMDEFGYSRMEMGMLASALTLTYGIGQFINGNLSDRFGRIMMPIGAVLSCIANWAFSFAPDLGEGLQPVLGVVSLSTTIFATMCFLWMFNGYSQAMGMATGGRLISNWWPADQRGRAMGLYTFSAAMANVTVFVLATWAANRWGWRAAFRYPVTLMAMISVLFYLVTKDYPEQAGLTSPYDPRANVENTRQHGIWHRYRVALSNRGLLLTGMSIALHHVARWGLLSFIPLFFMDVYGWQVKKAGFVATALPLGMAMGAVTGGWISDRVFSGHRSPIITISLCSCALFVILLPSLADGTTAAPESVGQVTTLVGEDQPATVNTWVVSGMLVISGFALYLCIGPYFALPADLLGHEGAGTGIGILNAFGYAGAAIGVSTIGWLVDRFNYTIGFWFMAGCAVLAAVLIQLLHESSPSEN